MRKSEFNDLVGYLKARPAEARRLWEVLAPEEAEEQPETCTWVGIMKASRTLGVSDDWMRKHQGAFPERMQIPSRGKMVLRFREETLKDDYTAFLRSQSNNGCTILSSDE